MPTDNNTPSRRNFLKTSATAAAAGSVLSSLNAVQAAHTSYDETIRLGMIGCGGRCTGAANQAMNTEGPTKLIAMCDAFEDRLQGSLKTLTKAHKDKIDVPAERQFVGFEGYKQLLATDIDLVLIATPPGFRPVHFEAAVKAGKHIFAEKPVAVDAAGIRRFMKAVEESKKKDLLVQIGLQRRHEPAYKETIKRLQDGAIGDIVAARAYWNGGGVWTRNRQPGQTEMEYQMRNWYYFNWLCGDHIVEQHIHNLDVINWLMGSTPVKAQGQGGRQVRTSKEHGEIYDHHMVEFTYGDTDYGKDTMMLSQCRHIPKTWGKVDEFCHGSNGSCHIGKAQIFDSKGNETWSYGRGGRDGHQQEHHDLFADLRAGKLPNEGEYGATSTMTSILGRMCTYSGQEISWEDAWNSDVVISPIDKFTGMSDTPPVLPNEDMTYPIAMPGQTKVI
ncbi:Gfo/Idh/MocA family protein [Fuerstiella marisgermanici]|uniref:Inositol 2-dehydrogenase n=1 Tax=Fuerstiella marisgermanici TaxID=1891926 RepID=A0A1P8WA91_9PLAN|nr:Gfo/Idh/MocA family oxidoreductase [Fuerstiella marisgermanici]APZ90970.1 Inositol 2-dehydrogenase [Fuerstiella marisgermanici]